MTDFWAILISPPQSFLSNQSPSRQTVLYPLGVKKYYIESQLGSRDNFGGGGQVGEKWVGNGGRKKRSKNGEKICLIGTFGKRWHFAFLLIY